MYKKFATQGDNMFGKNSLLNQKFQKLLYKRIFGSPSHILDLKILYNVEINVYMHFI